MGNATVGIQINVSGVVNVLSVRVLPAGKRIPNFFVPATEISLPTRTLVEPAPFLGPYSFASMRSHPEKSMGKNLPVPARCRNLARPPRLPRRCRGKLQERPKNGVSLNTGGGQDARPTISDAGGGGNGLRFTEAQLHGRRQRPAVIDRRYRPRGSAALPTTTERASSM